MRPIVELNGSLRAAVEERAEGLSGHLRSSVERASIALQQNLRSQTQKAGLGQGLTNAWRRDMFPRTRKKTFHPAALVFSKSILHQVFSQGATILPRRGAYLAIPLPAAIERRLHQTNISRKGGVWGGGTPRKASMLDEASKALGAPIVSARPGGKHGAARSGTWKPYILLTRTRGSATRLVALWFARQGERAIPLFVLVRQVTLSPRIDIAAEANAAASELAAEIERWS